MSLTGISDHFIVLFFSPIILLSFVISAIKYESTPTTGLFLFSISIICTVPCV